MKNEEITTSVMEAQSNIIPCIRCKGMGVHPDKLDPDGGIIECSLCNVPNGYIENSFEYKRSMRFDVNDDNSLEIL